MFLKRNKSFTLLELLVVVAIVALLVIIASTIYSQQREAGRRAAIESNLIGVRRVAEDIATIDFSYAGLCNHSNFDRIEAEVDRINPHDTQVFCVSEINDYCVSVQIGENEHYCLDSTGFQSIVESHACAEDNPSCQ